MNRHTSRQLTVRVRNDLADEADAYCSEVGLTFNGLVAVALSDFLFLRRKRAVKRPAPAARPAATIAPPAGKVGRNDPCPCGSGQKHKRCCGNPLKVV